MDRSNHYEAAFEAFLQWQGLCYVAVDETRRAQLGGSRVKSLDFVVYGETGSRLVVDVKGRRFPGGPPGRPRRVWENWSTREDVDGLQRWAELFGDDYRGLLVFAYHVLPVVELPGDTEDLWLFPYYTDRRQVPYDAQSGGPAEADWPDVPGEWDARLLWGGLSLTAVAFLAVGLVLWRKRRFVAEPGT